MNIAVSRLKDDDDHESVTISAILNVTFYTVSGIGYHTDSSLITVYVKPNDHGYVEIRRDDGGYAEIPR